MSEVPTTVGALLSVDSGGTTAEDLLDEEQRKDLSLHIKDVPGMGIDLVTDAVKDSLEPLFDMDLVDIFCGGWTKLQELQAYRDPDQHPPQEISLVPIVTHQITSEHHPGLEILVGPTRVTSVKLDVELQVTLEAVVLKVQAGRIREVMTGAFQGEGTIKCRGKTLIARSTPKYNLPASIPLGDGIEIPAL